MKTVARILAAFLVIAVPHAVTAQDAPVKVGPIRYERPVDPLPGSSITKTSVKMFVGQIHTPADQEKFRAILGVLHFNYIVTADGNIVEKTPGKAPKGSSPVTQESVMSLLQSGQTLTVVVFAQVPTPKVPKSQKAQAPLPSYTQVTYTLSWDGKAKAPAKPAASGNTTTGNSTAAK